jgi:hypothetical protein
LPADPDLVTLRPVPVRRNGAPRTGSWVSLWRFRFYLRPYALRFVSMAVFAGLGIAATIVVERLHDYLERSFLPGRSFCSPLDFVHHAEVVSLRGDSYRLKDRDLGRPTSAANDDQ